MNLNEVVYVGNVPKKTKDMELVDFFKDVGRVIEMCGMRGNRKDCRTKILFVLFENEMQALKACSLDQTIFQSNRVIVMLANDERHFWAGHAVIVRNFSSEINEADLFEAFRQYGKIEDVQIPTDNFAYIGFREKSAAAAALRSNNTRLGNTKIMVQVSQRNMRVRLEDFDSFKTPRLYNKLMGAKLKYDSNTDENVPEPVKTTGQPVSWQNKDDGAVSVDLVSPQRSPQPDVCDDVEHRISLDRVREVKEIDSDKVRVVPRSQGAPKRFSLNKRKQKTASASFKKKLKNEHVKSMQRIMKTVPNPDYRNPETNNLSYEVVIHNCPMYASLQDLRKHFNKTAFVTSMRKEQSPYDTKSCKVYASFCSFDDAFNVVCMNKRFNGTPIFKHLASEKPKLTKLTTMLIECLQEDVSVTKMYRHLNKWGHITFVDKVDHKKFIVICSKPKTPAKLIKHANNLMSQHCPKIELDGFPVKASRYFDVLNKQDAENLPTPPPQRDRSPGQQQNQARRPEELSLRDLLIPKDDLIGVQQRTMNDEYDDRRPPSRDDRRHGSGQNDPAGASCNNEWKRDFNRGGRDSPIFRTNLVDMDIVDDQPEPVTVYNRYSPENAQDLPTPFAQRECSLEQQQNQARRRRKSSRRDLPIPNNDVIALQQRPMHDEYDDRRPPSRDDRRHGPGRNDLPTPSPQRELSPGQYQNQARRLGESSRRDLLFPKDDLIGLLQRTMNDEYDDHRPPSWDDRHHCPNQNDPVGTSCNNEWKRDFNRDGRDSPIFRKNLVDMDIADDQPEPVTVYQRHSMKNAQDLPMPFPQRECSPGQQHNQVRRRGESSRRDLPIPNNDVIALQQRPMNDEYDDRRPQSRDDRRHGPGRNDLPTPSPQRVLSPGQYQNQARRLGESSRRDLLFPKDDLIGLQQRTMNDEYDDHRPPSWDDRHHCPNQNDPVGTSCNNEWKRDFNRGGRNSPIFRKVHIDIADDQPEPVTVYHRHSMKNAQDLPMPFPQRECSPGQQHNQVRRRGESSRRDLPIPKNDVIDMQQRAMNDEYGERRPPLRDNRRHGPDRNDLPTPFPQRECSPEQQQTQARRLGEPSRRDVPNDVIAMQQRAMNDEYDNRRPPSRDGRRHGPGRNDNPTPFLQRECSPEQQHNQAQRRGESSRRDVSILKNVVIAMQQRSINDEYDDRRPPSRDDRRHGPGRNDPVGASCNNEWKRDFNRGGRNSPIFRKVHMDIADDQPEPVTVYHRHSPDSRRDFEDPRFDPGCQDVYHQGDHLKYSAEKRSIRPRDNYYPREGLDHQLDDFNSDRPVNLEEMNRIDNFIREKEREIQRRLHLLDKELTDVGGPSRSRGRRSRSSSRGRRRLSRSQSRECRGRLNNFHRSRSRDRQSRSPDHYLGNRSSSRSNVRGRRFNRPSLTNTRRPERVQRDLGNAGTYSRM